MSRVRFAGVRKNLVIFACICNAIVSGGCQHAPSERSTPLTAVESPSAANESSPLAGNSWVKSDISKLLSKTDLSSTDVEKSLEIFARAKKAFSSSTAGFIVSAIGSKSIKFNIKNAKTVDVDKLNISADEQELFVLNLAREASTASVVIRQSGRPVAFIAPGKFGGRTVSIFARVDSTGAAEYSGVLVLGGTNAVLISADKSDNVPASFSYFPLQSGVAHGVAIMTRRENNDFFIVRKEAWSQGARDGESQEFYSNGNLKSHGVYARGKKSGTHREYFMNSLLKREAKYIEGKVDGVSTAYFENGKIESQWPFKKGVPEGLWIWFDEEGRKKMEWPYRDGERDGVVKIFSTDTISEQRYRAGRAVGPEITRSQETGKKISELLTISRDFMFDNGQKVSLSFPEGEVREFDENTGGLSRITKLVRQPAKLADGTIGYVKTIIDYAPNAREIGKHSEICWVKVVRGKDYYSFNGSETECKIHGIASKSLPNGNKVYVERYDQDTRVGEQRYFWPNGKLKKIQNFNQDDKLAGVTELYFENGRIESRTFYVDGETNGERVEYYPSGKVARKGVLEPGEKSGESLWVEYVEYYESGRPKKQCDFRSNKCVQWDVTGKRFDVAH